MTAAVLSAAGLIVAAGLAIWEIRRANRRRLGGRIAAVVASIAALLGIALRPGWRLPVSAERAVLLTAGAEPTRALRLADSVGAARVFALPDARVTSQDLTPRVVSIPDAGYLRRNFPGVGTVLVSGWGLDWDQWADLGGLSLEYDAALLPEGFLHVSWPRQIQLGDAVIAAGTLHRGGTAITQVFLDDPAGPADSLPFTGLESEDVPFRLQAQTRAVGRFLYVLRAATAEGHTVVAETLGVAITPPALPRVLIVEAAPSFESLYLKRWLSELGGSVAIRTRVSRDRFLYEFLNRAKADLTALSSSLLDSTDVLLIDGKTLSSLSAAERTSLRNAVLEQGLGVLLGPDALGPRASRHSASFLLGLSLARAEGDEERKARPVWVGHETPGQTLVPIIPGRIESRGDGETLLRDAAGGALAQSWAVGAGRVGVSLIAAPSRWLLAGEREVFASYWSLLLSAVATPLPEHWGITPTGPVLVDQPATVSLTTGAPTPAGLVLSPNGEVDSVFLAQDPFDRSRWSGVYWPRFGGWHEVTSLAGTGRLSFYAQPAGQWAAVTAARRLAASRQYLELNQAVPADGEHILNVLERPIPVGWFFALFLLSVTFLWLEGRSIVSRYEVIRARASAAPGSAGGLAR